MTEYFIPPAPGNSGQGHDHIVFCQCFCLLANLSLLIIFNIQYYTSTRYHFCTSIWYKCMHAWACVLSASTFRWYQNCWPCDLNTHPLSCPRYLKSGLGCITSTACFNVFLFSQSGFPSPNKAASQGDSYFVYCFLLLWILTLLHCSPELYLAKPEASTESRISSSEGYVHWGHTYFRFRCTLVW